MSLRPEEVFISDDDVKKIILHQENWRKEFVDEVKKEVKADLENRFADKAPSKRLVYILKEINQAEPGRDTKNVIRHFVLCISALAHHSRHGGLKSSEIKSLGSLAYNILQRSKIRPVTSKLAYLYGEINLVMSQISRLRREHWKSAWEQQMAIYFSGSSHINSDHYEALTLAIRMRRLGQIGESIKNYEMAYRSDKLSDYSYAQAGLGLLKCYRFVGDQRKVEHLANELFGKFHKGERYYKEVEWEMACSELKFAHEIKPLLYLTRRAGSHFSSIYLLELTLWLLSLQESRYHRKIPDLEQLVRKKVIAAKENSLLLRSVEILVGAYNAKEALPARVRELDFIVENFYNYNTIEQQLLFAVGIYRFLIRHRMQKVSHLFYFQYNRAMMNFDEVITDPLGVGITPINPVEIDEAS